MKTIFVTGAHTDIGKTHVACALLQAARAQDLSVAAFKPVVSGFDERDWRESDPGRLLAAMDIAPTPAALAAISPWRFAAPLSPPMAAAREGRRLDLDEIAAACRAWLDETAADFKLIEGVGGVMSPITQAATGLDLMARLAMPNLLVGGSYLGAISHTLTALEVLRARGLPPLALVVSQSGEADAPDFTQTVESVRAFAGNTPVIAAGRGETAWGGAVLAAA